MKTKSRKKRNKPAALPKPAGVLTPSSVIGLIIGALIAGAGLKAAVVDHQAGGYFAVIAGGLFIGLILLTIYYRK